MADLRSKLNTLYSLEQLAAGQTAVHRLHPRAKLAVTACYLLCVVSLDRLALTRLAPFLFYPAVVLAAADIPARMIWRRSLTALPFCLFAGVSNLLLDRAVVLRLGGIPVTAGALSLAVLLTRTFLCVSAVLILVAVTPFPLLTDELRRLRLPETLVLLLEMIYRYLGILADEADAMLTAFRLRSCGLRWPRLTLAGPFIGQLLLRSADRAGRIYQAMQCRGFRLRKTPAHARRWTAGDTLFLLAGCGSSLVFRFWDIPGWAGGWLPW